MSRIQTQAKTKPALSMQTAQVQSDFSIELKAMPKPTLPKAGAIVRMTACGLCGSDLDKIMNQKIASGTVLGHEVVGIIETLDENHHTTFKIGDRIVSAHHVPCGHCHYCLNNSESMCRKFKSSNLAPGGFAEHFSLTQGHLKNTAFLIPDDIDDDEASCVEPLACVLKAIRRGRSFVNGSVAVIGLGFIGMMASQVYKNQGYSVYGIDLDKKRLDFAQSQNFINSGFRPHLKEEKDALMQALEAQKESGRLNRVDLVFLTVLNEKTLELALELIRDSGTIVVFSSAAKSASLSDPKLKALIDPSVLYFREINLIPSYSPALQDLKEASRMIFSRDIRVKSLCTHQRPLAKLQEALELYQQGEALKVIITP